MKFRAVFTQPAGCNEVHIVPQCGTNQPGCKEKNSASDIFYLFGANPCLEIRPGNKTSIFSISVFHAYVFFLWQ